MTVCELVEKIMLIQSSSVCIIVTILDLNKNQLFNTFAF